MAEYITNVVGQTSKLDWAFPFERKGQFPLDRSALFSSLADAQKYATGAGDDERKLGGTSYVGQVISVYEAGVDDAPATVNAYIITPARGLMKLAATTTSGDVTADIAELQGKVATLISDLDALEAAVSGMYTNEQIDALIAGAKDDRVDALVEKVGSAAEGETAATGLYALIDAETARATAAEKALTDADTALDTAVKAAQKTADDTKARVDAFLDTEGLADTIDSLKDIKDELEALTDATELANAIVVKADKVTGATAGNFAGLDANGNLTDSGKKATDFATPAEVKAVDDKLANYYTKEEIAGLNHATKGELETAITTEAERAGKAEKANADAITAIKDHETVDSFADVVAELAKKQDKLTEGAYATESYVTGQINTLKTVDIADAAALGQKGIDNAAAAQGTANEAKGIAEGAAAKAGTNETNLANLTAVVQGEGGHASQISGLTERVGTAEGTIATHTENIGKNATAAANAQAQADEALRVANLKTTMGEVEAKGYAVAETVNAEIAKKTTMAEVEAKGYAVAETVNADLAKKADKETTYTKTEVDGLIAPLATTENLNKVQATAEQGVADAAVAKGVADAAKARIDAFIDGTAEAESAIDTLVEIQQYMNADTLAFTQLSNKVTNIENGTTTVPKATDADTVDGKHASDFEIAGAAEDALAEAKEYADAINTGVMSVESLTDLLVITTDENGNVKIALPNEIIFNGGGANV